MNQSALKKYLKIKVKSIEGKINTYFHNNGILNEGSHCICLSLMLIECCF